MGKKMNTESFKNKIFNLVGDEYTVLGEYTGTGNKLLMKHNCGYEWEVAPRNFLRTGKFAGTRCPICSSSPNIKKNTESFKKEVFNLVGDEYTVLGEYGKNTFDPILLRHNICGTEYMKKPNHFLQGDRCSKCSPYAGGGKDTDYFKKEVFNLVADEYTVLGEYISCKKKILIKHNACENEYLVTPTHFTSDGNRCPICNESKGEKLIRNYLESNNIIFESQYTLKLDDITLRADFYINEYNTIREYDGEFHYHPIFSKKELKNQKLRDSFKNEYCKLNSIRMIRIPYWEKDNIEKILNGLFNEEEYKATFEK